MDNFEQITLKRQNNVVSPRIPIITQMRQFPPQRQPCSQLSLLLLVQFGSTSRALYDFVFQCVSKREELFNNN